MTIRVLTYPLFRPAPKTRQRSIVLPNHWNRFLSSHVSNRLQTPIAIVGGGPSGLLLSNLLSSYQVPSVLVDGQSLEERCSHPQAHFLNTRSMEILRQLPRVYSRLQGQMTPVEQWKFFQFGYNMLPETAMARVDHPVNIPLLANVDANGTLMEEGNQSSESSVGSLSRPLSACSVGHLAQHTFCRILYEAAAEEALSDTQLLYSTQVTELSNSATKNGGYEIKTDTNLKIKTPVCLAADGAHSFCRTKWDVNQVGQVGIQHLLNIHVKTCPEWARSYLHEQGMNYAMLYSTFHPNVVAMIVCHSIGEYVFQVPFFPPYQAAEDFSPQRVQQMVYDAMGLDTKDNTIYENAKIEVVSVKPWTMSSLIADSYYHTNAGGSVGYLVGDAAHVFPPAGGLGMNTGMQDVYSLAWKLAWAYHQGHLSLEKAASNQTSAILKRIGASYEQERRPVAQFNAALSVRNYNRILEITKACYLNDEHPTLLIRALEASSMLVPFGARREIFQRLYATATWALSSLRDPNHPYTKHLRQNIRSILARGGALPLLFPTAELGFGCTHEANSNHDRPREEDTIGFKPSIRVGHLFPHVEATVVNSPSYNTLNIFASLKPLGSDFASSKDVITISLSDLPAQVSMDRKPCFVLLKVAGVRDNSQSEALATHTGMEAAKHLSSKLGLAVEFVEAWPSSASTASPSERSQHLVLREVPHQLEGSLLDAYQGSMWLVRPDGHVAGGGCESTCQLEDNLLQVGQEALFG